MSEKLNFCRSCPATSPDKCWNPQSCTHAAMDRLIAEDADLIDPVQDRLVLAVRELAADDSQWVAEAFAATLRKALAMHGLAIVKGAGHDRD